MGEGYIAIFLIGGLSSLNVVVWATLGFGSRRLRLTWMAAFFVALAISVWLMAELEQVLLRDAAFLLLCAVILSGFAWAPIVRALTLRSNETRLRRVP